MLKIVHVLQAKALREGISLDQAAIKTEEKLLRHGLPEQLLNGLADATQAASKTTPGLAVSHPGRALTQPNGRPTSRRLDPRSDKDREQMRDNVDLMKERAATHRYHGRDRYGPK